MVVGVVVGEVVGEVVGDVVGGTVVGMVVGAGGPEDTKMLTVLPAVTLAPVGGSEDTTMPASY